MSQNLQTFNNPEDLELPSEVVASEVPQQVVDQQFAGIISANYDDQAAGSLWPERRSDNSAEQLVRLSEEILHISAWLDYERAQKLTSASNYNPALSGIVQRLFGQTTTVRQLMNREAMLSSQIWGQTEATKNEQFFYFGQDPEGYSEWIWHRYQSDAASPATVLTSRYEIYREGIITKIQDDQPYRRVESAEAQNLHAAVSAYWQLVKPELYS